MLIGIPNEPEQNLVSAPPDSVRKLVTLGYTVRVEHAAGNAASFPDEQYLAAGAEIVESKEVWESDVVICLDEPPAEKLELLRPGVTLISRLDPNSRPQLVEKLTSLKVNALAMDAVPRISRAQSMDVRSSMANIAGYRAVIEAANAFGRVFTGQVTAAGKVPPANVYVIGAGVAGLAAVGAASSMGAQVSGTDVRPEVAEQVESMGGRFVPIPVSQESSDGYARAMSEDQAQQAQAVYTREAIGSDIVITTAQIPGKPAPTLITADAVAQMRPGSVIVDLGASTGGNCELTRPGEVYTTANGVTIIGYEDLARRLPGQASQLYGQNIMNFLKLATPQKDGNLVLDQSDQVVRGVTVTFEGTLMWPPPPISVSAAPQATPAPTAEQVPAPIPPVRPSFFKRTWWKALLVAVFTWLILTAPPDMQGHFFVFALAVFLGFYVITAVTHSLHTPLMSVTNAISGIIIVGAITQITSAHVFVVVASSIAIVVASINIFGGFTVTHRMLKMFARS